jgi:hypothetical protein
VSGEVIRRHTYGEPRWAGNPIIGIASIGPRENTDPNHIRVITGGASPRVGSLQGYAAYLTDLDLDAHDELARDTLGVPGIHKAEHIEHHLRRGHSEAGL